MNWTQQEEYVRTQFSRPYKVPNDSSVISNLVSEMSNQSVAAWQVLLKHLPCVHVQSRDYVSSNDKNIAMTSGTLAYCEPICCKAQNTCALCKPRCGWPDQEAEVRAAACPQYGWRGERTMFFLGTLVDLWSVCLSGFQIPIYTGVCAIFPLFQPCFLWLLKCLPSPLILTDAVSL